MYSLTCHLQNSSSPRHGEARDGFEQVFALRLRAWHSGNTQQGVLLSHGYLSL